MTVATLERAAASFHEAAAAAPQAVTCTTITQGPECVNLVLYRGDDFYMDVTVSYQDDGTGVDLTSAVVTAQIKVSPDAEADPIAEFTSVIDANIIHLHLPSNQAAELPPHSVWDCQITMPDVTTLVAGTITTVPDVSQQIG